MSPLRLGRLVTYFEDDEPWYSWWDDDGKVGLLLSPFVTHVVGPVGEIVSRGGCNDTRTLVSPGLLGDTAAISKDDGSPRISATAATFGRFFLGANMRHSDLFCICIHGADICLRWRCIGVHAMSRRCCSIVPSINTATSESIRANMVRRNDLESECTKA
jgi:hypothetical protein